MQTSGHVIDDKQIPALDVFHDLDGGKSRYIQEVLYWYREKDAGNLRGKAPKQLVQNMTALNAHRGRNSKTIGKERKNNQKIAMAENIVKNSDGCLN